MIRVTKLDSEEIIINEQNIQWIEEKPDTIITFIGGARLIVKNSITDIIDKIKQSQYN